MTKDIIQVDIGAALQALQASPELAGMINELIAPTAAKQMEADAQEIDRLRKRVNDLLEANNRYQQEGRDARAQLKATNITISKLQARIDRLLHPDARVSLAEMRAIDAEKKANGNG